MSTTRMTASHPDPIQRPGLPVVYINLDEDTGRRAALEAQFAAAGVEAQRHPATRWTRLSTAAQAALYSEALNRQSYFRPLVAGEKGCYASHIEVWRALLASDAPGLVVLEDDVELEPDFAEVVNAIAALPPGWNMVKLIGREREKAQARQPLTARHALVDYRRVPSLTAGYVISREGARKLLAARVPYGRPIDIDLRLWWECDLSVQGVVPAAIRLAESSDASSIGQRESRSLALRWRKFIFKLAYSWANARALRRHQAH